MFFWPEPLHHTPSASADQRQTQKYIKDNLFIIPSCNDRFFIIVSLHTTKRKGLKVSKLETLKELMALVSEADPKVSECGVADQFIGQYAIIRSRNEGINAGEIVAADATGVVLKNARRIWYHRPAEKSESWYEGVANHGLSEDSKISGVVSRKAIIEDYSITICTDIAKQSLEEAPAHAQS